MGTYRCDKGFIENNTYNRNGWAISRQKTGSDYNWEVLYKCNTAAEAIQKIIEIGCETISIHGYRKPNAEAFELIKKYA